MKNVMSNAMVLTGTFIGAGFASGQEIWQYFGVFGNFGIAGITISCLLLFFFTYCTYDNISCLGKKLYIKRVCNFKWVNRFLNCYMLLIFSTMITAFGECLNQFLNFPKIYGVIFIDVVTIIILYFGAEGMIKLNVLVTPLIIAGIVFALFVNNSQSVFSYNNFATSAVIYASYNIISMPFVMVGLKNKLNSKKQMMWCSAIFGGIIFVLAFCIMKIMKNTDVLASIPLLNAVKGTYSCIFVFVLSMSMLTTAVSNGFGFVNGVLLNKKVSLAILFVLAILFSLFSFEFIVKYLYSLFGYAGLYILFVNFYIFIKNREKPRKLKINKNKLL